MAENPSDQNLVESVKELTQTRGGIKRLERVLEEAGYKRKSGKLERKQTDAYIAGFTEAAEKAKEQGKGGFRQTLAGMKGGKEREEQYQLATLGTKRSRENFLKYFMGGPAGNVFRGLFEKEGKPEEIEKAKKQFGMDEESLKKKKEEEDKKKAEKESEKQAKKEKVAGANKVLLDEILHIKKVVQSLAKVILVNRGYKSEIDPKTGKILYREKKTGRMAGAEKATFARFDDVTERKTIEARELEAKTEKERGEKLTAATEAELTPQAQMAKSLKAIVKAIGKSRNDMTLHDKLDAIMKKVGAMGGGGGAMDLVADVATGAAAEEAAAAAAGAIGAGAVVGAAGAVAATGATFYAFDQSVKQMASNAVDKLAKTSAKDIAIAFEKGYRPDWTRAQLYLRAEKDQKLKDKLHEADKIVVKDGYNLPGASEEYTNKVKKDVEAEDKARFEAAAAPPAPVAPPTTPTAAATPELSEVQVTAQKIATPEPTEVQVTAQKIATPEPTEVQVTARAVTPPPPPTAAPEGPKFKEPSGKPSMGKNGLLLPSENVSDAIKNAAKAVGVDHGIMLAMAKQESGFNPNAKAGTSSASGLYQFIDTTWNSMVQKYGKKFPDLLKGRFDLNASAIAGALFIKENVDILKKNGIDVNGTSVYASHFLGPGGALKLFSANPLTAAVNVLGEKVAAANKSIFYEKDGKTPRTIADVQQFLYNKVGKMSEMYSAYAAGPSISPAATMVAQSSPSPKSQAASSITPAPSTTGSEMSAQSANYATSQMVAQNQPQTGPVVINNTTAAPAQQSTPKQNLPAAGTRSQESSFGRSLARDFAHPTTFSIFSAV